MQDSANGNWVWLPVAAIIAPAYAADYVTAEQAAVAFFPDADSRTTQILSLDKEQRSRIKLLSGMRQRWKKQTVFRAEKDGGLQGWMVVDDVVGKHEYITYAVGISVDGRVLGIEILSYRETHGDEIRQAGWRKQFENKTLTDAFRLDVDIFNISGATLSCRNVMDGVKRLLAFHQVVLAP